MLYNCFIKKTYTYLICACRDMISNVVEHLRANGVLVNWYVIKSCIYDRIWCDYQQSFLYMRHPHTLRALGHCCFSMEQDNGIVIIDSDFVTLVVQIYGLSDYNGVLVCYFVK